MGGRSGSSTPLCGTPNRERNSPFSEREIQTYTEREKSSPFGERPPSSGSVRSPLATTNSNMDMPSCMVCFKTNIEEISVACQGNSRLVAIEQDLVNVCSYLRHLMENNI